MKTVYIITIAIVASVGSTLVILFGVPFAWQELEYQMALAEHDELQQFVVTEFNKEMERCRNTFVNLASAWQCQKNAEEYFETDLLDSEHFIQLHTGFSQEAQDELEQTLERLYGDELQQMQALERLYGTETENDFDSGGGKFTGGGIFLNGTFYPLRE